MSGLNEYRSVELSRPVKLYSDPEDKMTLLESVTIPKLLRRASEKHPHHPALVYQDAESQKWVTINYSQYLERVEKTAKVFIKLGLKRHGVVAVLAFNSVEWFVSELAAVLAGGVICGIYQTNGPDACLHILESSKASILIVDDDRQLEKIREIRKKLPHLKAVVQTLTTQKQVLSKFNGYHRWCDIEAMETDDVEAEYKKRQAQIVASECCALIYTSGTVGMPKGVMISHDNLTFDESFANDRIPFLEASDRFVSYLPLSHIAAQKFELIIPLFYAGTVYFTDKNAMKGTLMKTVRKAKPTMFFGVPRVFEKIQEKIMENEADSGYLKQLIVSWAKEVTLVHYLDKLNGQEQFSLQFLLVELLVNSKVKATLGFEDCHTIITGSAPISIETKKYFLSLGIRILDSLVLTETSATASFSSEIKSLETAGKPLIGLKAKVDKPDENGVGELCFKGRHIFMGYLGEPLRTQQAFDADGWLKSGDLGYINSEGFIFVTGRIKELIITAGGEKILPYLIEKNVKAECPAISNAVLVGDRRKFLTMLVTLKTQFNPDGVPIDAFAVESLSWLESLGLLYTKHSEVLAAGPDPVVMKAIQEAIDRANEKAISNAQKVQKFAILPHDFSIPTGELGPTLKLRRWLVMKKYSKIIEQLYK